MGNWVTAEALRQIKISGALRNVNKFGVTVLAAPDIDIDVSKSQMRRFGNPQKPLYIVLSKDDRALWASKFIAGGETRVGDDPNVRELAAMGANVIDLTGVKADDPTNHDKFAQLAEVAPQLRQVLAKGVGARRGALADSRDAAGTRARLDRRPADHARRGARPDDRRRIARRMENFTGGSPRLEASLRP